MTFKSPQNHVAQSLRLVPTHFRMAHACITVAQFIAKKTSLGKRHAKAVLSRGEVFLNQTAITDGSQELGKFDQLTVSGEILQTHVPRCDTEDFQVFLNTMASEVSVKKESASCWFSTTRAGTRPKGWTGTISSRSSCHLTVPISTLSSSSGSISKVTTLQATSQSAWRSSTTSSSNPCECCSTGQKPSARSAEPLRVTATIFGKRSKRCSQLGPVADRKPQQGWGGNP